jgi:hypothetical protein
MKINPNIAISENGLLFNPATGESYSTNPIGAEIITLMKKGLSPEAIRDTLMESYDSDAYTIEKDILDFMHLLKNYSLISHDA